MKTLFIVSVSCFFLFFSFSASSLGSGGKTAQDYCVAGQKALEKGDIQEAYKLFKKSLKKDPNYYDSVWHLALLKVDMDSLKSAVWDFSFALQLRSTGEGYYQRGKAKWTLKDSIGACADFNSGCDLMHNRSCDQIHLRCR